MKLAVAYLYTITRYGYPPHADRRSRGHAALPRLGFRNIELEGPFREHLLAVHKDRRQRPAPAMIGPAHLQFLSGRAGMFPHGPADPAGGLRPVCPGVECAVEFGCETLHIATFHPPVKFRGQSPYTGTMNYATRYEVDVDPAFRFADYWKVVVETVRRSAEMAHAAGMKLIVEPRVGEVICHTDSLLRLIDWVDHPACNANLDLAHLHAQKELLPIAVEKLAVGSPGSTPRTMTVARTFICLRARVRSISRAPSGALCKHGYDGYVGIDVGGAGIADMDAALVESRRYLQQLAERTGFPLEG